jgi:hypothetical protein
MGSRPHGLGKRLGDQHAVERIAVEVGRVSTAVACSPRIGNSTKPAARKSSAARVPETGMSPRPRWCLMAISQRVATLTNTSLWASRMSPRAFCDSRRSSVSAQSATWVSRSRRISGRCSREQAGDFFVVTVYVVGDNEELPKGDTGKVDKCLLAQIWRQASAKKPTLGRTRP